MSKKAIVTVTNDISTDNRILKSAAVLAELGFEVSIFGRIHKNSLAVKQLPYLCIRKKLLFNKGPLFYAEYNIRLFCFLLFHKFDLIYANDLDTLLPCFIAHKLCKAPLIYDTHEYFTGVPELAKRPTVRKIWEMIEQRIFPHLKTIITVNKSIAQLYFEKYNKELQVVRNIPLYREPVLAQREALKLPLLPTKILILQGSGINVDRGAEEILEAMQFLHQAVLLIIGGGDVIEDLKNKVKLLKLEDKVLFISRQPYQTLMQYTASSDIGITLDKDTNINYRFSLPNKLFDYIQARIPVYASSLPEIKHIVKHYQVGKIASSHQPEIIAKEIQEMLNDLELMKKYQSNCETAALELCWENEKLQLMNILKPYSD
ncbi:MAG: glycosyltransferase [Bacteroidota bacterium]